jgi:ELP3 family radical SAM enzyme/protein acetyltransferase
MMTTPSRIRGSQGTPSGRTVTEIEDYCKELPSKHTWADLSVPDGDVEVLEKMLRSYALLLAKGLSADAVRKAVQKEHHHVVRPAHMNAVYQKAVAEGRMERNMAVEDALVSKVCRGLSGVSVVTVFLSPYPNGQQFTCKWNCSYCPNEPGQPRSYLFGEPGVLRANQTKFDCVAQIRNRITAYRVNGHPIDKFEVLILGGTIHSYPKSYLDDFMRDIYYAANTCMEETPRPAMSLLEEQNANTLGKHKVIGVTVETRPDCVTPAEIKDFRRWGVTRLQIGVQHTDDRILRGVNRGCGHKHTLLALKLLRDACFKVDIHLMPNLPGATPDADREMFDIVLKDLHPDQVKIYPCETTPFTKILDDYKSGSYVPYSNDELLEVVLYWKTRVHPWIRNNRIIRDIPEGYIVAGVPSSSERNVYHETMKKRGLVCHCIRCREAGRWPKADSSKGKLFVRTYEAQGGIEYFISWESEDEQVLFGFCRLRLPKEIGVFPELTGLGLVRELHVYGRTFATGTSAQTASTGYVSAVQHTGVGGRLLLEAEKIAWLAGYAGTAVIAGIGTRGYYSRTGYKLDGGMGGFMIKRFIHIQWIIGLALICGLVFMSRLLMKN